jgi:lysozyme
VSEKPQTPTAKGAKQVAGVLAAASLVAPLTLASEGLVTKTSDDPVAIPTACWGHANAQPGKVYSLGECEQIAVLDLAKAGAGIAPCIKAPVSDMTRGAFTDFALNAGVGAFCSSTMAKKLNAGDAAGACAELSRWVNAGGKPLPGLVTRRERERNLCECGNGDQDACEAVAKDPATAPLVAVAAVSGSEAQQLPAREVELPTSGKFNFPPAPHPRVVAAKPSLLTKIKDWLE